MENIDEDIKIVEEFINNYKEVQEKYKDDEIQAEIERSCYFEEVPAKAIENLLSRLKTAERMNDVLADKVYIEEMDFNCSPMCVHDNCINECIKEWARKKVEDE